MSWDPYFNSEAWRKEFIKVVNQLPVLSENIFKILQLSWKIIMAIEKLVSSDVTEAKSKFGGGDKRLTSDWLCILVWTSHTVVYPTLLCFSPSYRIASNSAWRVILNFLDSTHWVPLHSFVYCQVDSKNIFKNLEPQKIASHSSQPSKLQLWSTFGT